MNLGVIQRKFASLQTGYMFGFVALRKLFTLVEELSRVSAAPESAVSDYRRL